MDTQETIQVCYNKETQLEKIDVSQTDACQSLKQTLNMLEQMKFPVLIGVSSTLSSYDHVVVV